MDTTMTSETSQEEMQQLIDAQPQAEPEMEGGREKEIEEVMDFFRFSVKPATTFEGIVVFRFRENAKGTDGGTRKETTYAVHVNRNKEVTTEKNASTAGQRITCEISVSVDDFLYIYSGKAGASELAKMYYSGKLGVSGFAFRKVSSFASSFDYSSEKWREFYSYKEEQDNKQRSPSAIEETSNFGSPSRDYWFNNCKTILARYNISKWQRLTWETSVSSIFGESYVMTSVLEAVKTPSSHRIRLESSQKHPIEDQLHVFFHPLLLDTKKPVAPASATASTTGLATISSIEQRSHVLAQLAFLKENYVHQVKSSAKRRFHNRQVKDRMDLADAGMDQLDKFLQRFGLGHEALYSNPKRKNKSKFVPAPKLFLREFNSQAKEVVEFVKEKALGRKSVERIPAPNVSAVLLDATCTVNSLPTKAWSWPPVEGNEEDDASIIFLPPRTDRRQLRGRGTRRKELLKQKFASFQVDLSFVEKHPSSAAEEALALSDYI